VAPALNGAERDIGLGRRPAERAAGCGVALVGHHPLRRLVLAAVDRAKDVDATLHGGVRDRGVGRAVYVQEGHEPPLR
jgi:hypothetical protein